MGRQTEDLAFADTVVTNVLLEDGTIPPSSGVVVSRRHVSALAFPPHPMADPGVVTRVRLSWARIRHDVKQSREDMSELWDATASMERPSFGARLQMLWSFWEWDQADVARGAWIGLAVFLVAAAAGAYALF
jgi:hypothetical protein